ncbi:MAG: oligopeptide/dipeptide ABC transporter ATP-binding protein [Betaproteobacteria bacterium]
MKSPKDSSTDSSSAPLIEARGLHKCYQLSRQRLFEAGPIVRAVDDVTFQVSRGSTFGLVGESGSGKTTIAKMLLKIERPTQGSLLVDGQDIFAQDASAERAYRSTVQTVLQDPYGALSPRMRAGKIIAEPLVTKEKLSWAQAEGKAAELLALVGLRREDLHKFPHEFSGGQRQRIAIARALSVDPTIIVLDESVSALDVSVRAQILKLLEEVQRKLGVTYLFIGHDLAVVRYMSNDVGVMYLGQLVEVGSAMDVFSRPLHPYTRQLVAAGSAQARIGALVAGADLPSPINPPAGCRFHTRCPHATAECTSEPPPLREMASGHFGRCHHMEKIAA